MRILSRRQDQQPPFNREDQELRARAMAYVDRLRDEGRLDFDIGDPDPTKFGPLLAVGGEFMCGAQFEWAVCTWAKDEHHPTLHVAGTTDRYGKQGIVVKVWP